MHKILRRKKINCFGYNDKQYTFYHSDDGDTFVAELFDLDICYCFDDELLYLPEVKERFEKVMDDLFIADSDKHIKF